VQKQARAVGSPFHRVSGPAGQSGLLFALKPAEATMKMRDASGHPVFPEEFFNLVFQNSLGKNSLDVELRFRHKNGHVLQRYYRSKKQIKQDWYNILAKNSVGGYEVDFTVVPRETDASRKKEHSLPEPLILNCFWVDLDVGEGKPFSSRKAALRRIGKVGPDPTILVKSGRGLHAYYCLKHQKKITVERAKTLLKNWRQSFMVTPALLAPHA
jgi:hypothetical protein